MSEWISIPDYNDRIGTECIGCGKLINLGYAQSPLVPRLCDECKEAIKFAKELLKEQEQQKQGKVGTYMEERLYAKPILHPGGSGDPAMAEGAKYTCENCGNILRVVSEFVCKECGAKILWDEKLLRSCDKYEDWLATP